ncbi:hypothetical protein BER93_04020 [Xanthomonas fragariae]|nr:hypothetical protein BER92_04020 [Xanthomonas fragariae]AOD17425.1 hypothetical protein BER93_04020 [Xanthomonas fragariae]ENZ94463.1 hypothetical protein O1K_16766 [Xanthomonas fragariae LMG 25863]
MIEHANAARYAPAVAAFISVDAQALVRSYFAVPPSFRSDAMTRPHWVRPCVLWFSKRKLRC